MGAGPYAYGYTFIMNNANDSSKTINLWSSSFVPTPAGSQFLGADSTYYPDSVNQDITGLTVGKTYTVSFLWGGAQQSGFTGDTTDKWSVSLGSETHATDSISVPSKGFTGWLDVSMNFTATSAEETLSFLASGTCALGGCGPFESGSPPFALLDDVSLTASVPEPSTWAMMALGFAGLGYAGYRRRRQPISIIA